MDAFRAGQLAHGDTHFNEWPVTMYQLAQMSTITTTEHEAIFALDTAIDEGAEDGAGAAMVNDLGDIVVPFPGGIPCGAVAGDDTRVGY